jgi:hypothetical protein
MLVRQFDSVGVFLVALVLFSKHLFQPPCLLLRNPFIHRSGTVAQDELLAAAITPGVPISCNPAVFSRLLFFMDTAPI